MPMLPDWLRGYSSSRLALDLVAGLSLAAFAIPESLAYASLAGLPPISGLYCYLVAGVAYAWFGTSRQRIALLTVVTPHNLFGRAYLFVILPFHRAGVRALLSRAVAAGRL